MGLRDVAPGSSVLVACSGGADSMALAAGAAFEGAKAGWLVGAIVVDHGLHDDSAEVADTVARRLRSLAPFTGIEPVEVLRVEVGTAGGPEAAARRARYDALDAAAERGDAIVLLGHTRDDQAETVLLGLARGSGLRSLAGMRNRLGRYRRPLLDVTRQQTAQACDALGIPLWLDPSNHDPRLTRSRIRHAVLPLLEEQLGPGVAEALARTASLAGADADALDALAATLASAAGLAPTTGDRWAGVGPVEAGPREGTSDEGEVAAEPAAVGSASGGGNGPSLAADVLAAAPEALRLRVLRMAALTAGCPGGELFAVHVRSVDALVTDWHGQRRVELPGHVTVVRRGDAVVFFRSR